MRDSDDWEPALGIDEPAEDLEIRTRDLPTGERHAVVVPASVRRLTEEQSELVYGLQQRAMIAQQMRQQIDELVPEAREAGCSWAVIGWSVGLTGEAARLRWIEDQGDE